MNDKLHKMKLYEIQHICKKLKITYKRKNKSTLINILLNPLKYSYKMNVMKMTNGYPSQFPEYLTNNIYNYTEFFSNKDIKILLSNGMEKSKDLYEIKPINIDEKFVGLNYQPEGSHDLCWAYAIMSYLNKDGTLKYGDYRNNSLTALKWIQSLNLSLDDQHEILNKLIGNKELFDYWYDHNLPENDKYTQDISDIQELFNNLPEIITKHFDIHLYKRLSYISEKLSYISEKLSFDDIILNVIFDSDIKKASKFFTNIILSEKYGIHDFIVLLSMKKREGNEKQLEMIEYLETELTKIDTNNKQSLSAFIYEKILEYSIGIDENINGIIPVGSDDGSVHYYSIRNCKNSVYGIITSFFNPF
jgi:hypothetical protein